jgi:hypothetical protein
MIGRLSPEEVEAGRSARGGFTRAQLQEWGVSWPPRKGWLKRLTGRRSGLSPEEIQARSQAKRSAPRTTPRRIGDAPLYDGEAAPWEEEAARRAPKTGDLFRTDAAMSEAFRAAEDIRKWTDGPKAAGWRIARLAQAIVDAERAPR